MDVISPGSNWGHLKHTISINLMETCRNTVSGFVLNVEHKWALILTPVSINWPFNRCKMMNLLNYKNTTCAFILKHDLSATLGWGRVHFKLMLTKTDSQTRTPVPKKKKLHHSMKTFSWETHGREKYSENITFDNKRRLTHWDEQHAVNEFAETGFYNRCQTPSGLIRGNVWLYNSTVSSLQTTAVSTDQQ